MKHKMLILGVMLSCLLCFTGCGEQQTVENSIDESRFEPNTFTETNISQFVETVEDGLFESWYLKGITPENFEEKLYIQLMSGQETDEMYDTIRKGYDSWYKAVDQIGFNSKETLADDISVSGVNYNMNNKGQLVVTGKVHGTKHDADMVIYLDNRFNVLDIGVTAEKTLGEKLENAGLNTLMGMGMAFSILITISLIISLFPILFGGKKKKKESDKVIAQKAMDSTINQISEQEDLSSDAELVAVIAAAIAAYEGSGSTDGFRVRSIRKVNKNWKRI
ncbi:MAG: OadG family protein [Butyrivibrio sp.]|nr:OadG family protein [Butyrivibrio sp.]